MPLLKQTVLLQGFPVAPTEGLGWAAPNAWQGKGWFFSVGFYLNYLEIRMDTWSMQLNSQSDQAQSFI